MSTLPTSTTNMTGLRAICRGSSLAKRVADGPAHDRRVEQRRCAFARCASGWPAPGPRSSGCRDRRVAVHVTSSPRIADEVLDDGAEGDDGEVGEADDDERRRRRAGRRTAACRSGTCRPTAGTGCLRASEPAMASTGIISKNRPTSIDDAERGVEPVGVAGEPAERRAVVVAGRREGVDDLGQAVGPGLRSERHRGRRAAPTLPAKPRTTSGTARM